MSSAIDLLSTYVGSAADLGPWLSDAQINRDRNLRLQYLAGFGFNFYIGSQIRDAILRYRTFPSDYLIGSPASVDHLRALVMGGMASP